MFKEIRRKDRELTQDEAYELLNNCEYGILSTMGPNGYPYGVPLNYACSNDSIYFHCAVEGHKLENIENNSNVSFCVVNDTQIIPDKFATKYRSAVIFGKAKEVFGEEKKEGLLLLLNKYSSEFMETGQRYIDQMWEKARVFKIEIEHITAKGRKQI